MIIALMNGNSTISEKKYFIDITLKLNYIKNFLKRMDY